MRNFSVIIPTYNNAVTVIRSINCVINQTFTNWELVIVDDGSTDDTEKQISPFLEDDRIKYIKQKNQGVTVARNKGASVTTGEFICFLDSDDVVSENWLQDFYDVKNAKTGYISCGYIIKGEKLFPRVKNKISDAKYSSLAGTFSVRRDVFDQIGGYDILLIQSTNWEMTARAIENCKKRNLGIDYTTNCNFEYIMHNDPMYTNNRDRQRAEATLYLHNKYKDSGILHFRKNGFLKSSAVNYVRVGEIKKSRKVFHKLLKEDFSLKNVANLIAFEIPFLRRKLWLRKSPNKK
ncbi:glycosyltransferase family 2 protein [Salinimicrobium sediminilitoris]|uniref:glycosyltransferase family 2 protein n=1 Tax=Salinimicrobium sediminilitoris TaxID=2876715 RepID=UPI001E49FF92|nr:glycosyltransferase family A protein [Salinimicrobium sediminilitoris]MCC8358744.1 glycosyltransferase family 2 protein [Salinimicrobium sediminilitoris]